MLLIVVSPGLSSDDSYDTIRSASSSGRAIEMTEGEDASPDDSEETSVSVADIDGMDRMEGARLGNAGGVFGSSTDGSNVEPSDGDGARGRDSSMNESDWVDGRTEGARGGLGRR